MSTLTDQAHKAAIDAVKTETPSSFTVGGRFDGKTVIGGITFNRTWKNGWGATAYARAWWLDAPVAVGLPNSSGIEVGGEVVKRF